MLTGTLDDFTLPEMFRFLASCRKTGCIEVRRAAGEGRVFLREGDVYYGESSVTRGADDASHTSESLTRQIEASFFDLLRWEGGEFTFSPGLEVDLEPALSLDIETLINETAQKLEELGVIAGKIPSERAIPAMAPNPPADSSQINITPDEWRVLVLVSGSRTVEHIAEAVGLDAFSVMRTLYGLASTGLIEVVGEAEGPEPSVLEPIADVPQEAPAEIAPVREFATDVEPSELVAEKLDAEFPPFEPEDTVLANGNGMGHEVPVEEDASADPLALGEAAEAGLPEAAEASEGEHHDITQDEVAPDEISEEVDRSMFQDLDEPVEATSENEVDSASAVGDFEGVEAIPEAIPIEEAGADEDTVVDRLAAVKELADLFERSDGDAPSGPPYPAEIEAQRRQEEEEARVPDTRHRVEDDEEITRGLISRLIDGVKGL